MDQAWADKYRGKKSSGPDDGSFYVQFEDVDELGVKWSAVEGDDVFFYRDQKFVKQGDLNYIASLGRRRPLKIIVRSVADLLEIIARDAPGDWVFRGHSSWRWKLAASIHRLVDESPIGAEQKISFERELLGEFKRRARIFLQSPPKSDWEWMVIAQHFGLPTRILDWTENPLVALFFTVRDDANFYEDGMLYAYRHGILPIDIEATVGPFNISQLELLRPPHLDQRVIAQQSVFTVEPINLKDGGAPNTSTIRYWHVSARQKIQIKRELSKLGISEGTLFPGLESLATEIKKDALARLMSTKVTTKTNSERLVSNKYSPEKLK